MINKELTAREKALDAKMRKWMKNKRRYDGETLEVGDVILTHDSDWSKYKQEILIKNDMHMEDAINYFSSNDPMQLIIKSRDIPEMWAQEI